MPVDVTTPHSTDPTSFYGQSGKLSDTPDTSQVTTGAGGTAVVRDRDSMLGIAPSQQGITGTFRGTDAAMQSVVNSYAPLLTPGSVFPNMSDAVTSAFHHARGFLKKFEQPQGPVLPKEEDSDPLASLNREMRAHLKQIAPLSFQWKLRKSLLKKKEEEQRDTEDRGHKKQDQEEKEEDALLQEVAYALRARLDSTDPEEVFQALLLITPRDLLPMEAELRALAKEIAKRNAAKQNLELHSFDPKTTESRMQTLVPVSEHSADYRRRFSRLIVYLAYRLSALNAASLSAPPPDPLVQALASHQKEVVLEALQQLTEPNMPDIEPLAHAIAKQNQKQPIHALRSAHAAMIAHALQEVSQVVVHASDTSIEAIAAHLASHNESRLFAEMLACDPGTVLRALYNLVDTANLTDGEKAGIEHYLQAISLPTAYMNGLRCTSSLSDYTADEAWQQDTVRSAQKESEVVRALTLLKRAAEGHGVVDQISQLLARIESLKAFLLARGDTNATLVALGAIALMTSAPLDETKTIADVSASLAHGWLATALPTIASFCLLLATVGAIVMAMAEEFTSPDADEEEALITRTKNLFSAPKALRRVWSIFALSITTGALPGMLTRTLARSAGLDESAAAKISLVTTLLLWRLVVETTRKLEKDPEGNRAEESLDALLTSFSKQYKDTFTQVDTYFEMLRTLSILKEIHSPSGIIEYVRKQWTEFPWQEGSLQDDAERCAHSARTVLALFHHIVDEASSITSRMCQRT